MAEANFLCRIVTKLDSLPDAVRPRALSLFFGRTVRFAGTAGIRVEKLTTSESVLVLKNRGKVQNHIHSIHAAAMALLAESATGFLVAMNVPDSRVPVIKTLHIDYVKRASGDLRAHATLTAEQINQMLNHEKGEVTVAVTVTDSKGVEPIQCQMVWAWTPKIRRVESGDASTKA
jgi:acyl-coenzyme A thioesterase PaaI-like protein